MSDALSASNGRVSPEQLARSKRKSDQGQIKSPRSVPALHKGIKRPLPPGSRYHEPDNKKRGPSQPPERVISPAMGVSYTNKQQHASTSIEPEMLGNVEPGTHVQLDGVVWNETDSGMLVVNVCWRGKSYVGTLLDCTRYDWAPPRHCDSPLLELTPGKSRNGHAKRRATAAANGNKSKAMKIQIPASTSQVNSDNDDANSQSNDVDHCGSAPLSPILYECPCRQCDKKFVNQHALKYHQNARHRTFPGSLSGSSNNSENSSTQSLSPEEQEHAKLPCDVKCDKNEQMKEEKVDDARHSAQTPPLMVKKLVDIHQSPCAYSDISDDTPKRDITGVTTNQSTELPMPPRSASLTANFSSHFFTNTLTSDPTAPTSPTDATTFLMTLNDDSSPVKKHEAITVPSPDAPEITGAKS